jgi:hypothetical protein
MNGLKHETHQRLDGKRVGFWRSSTYDEPTWVSLAWLVIPLLIAATLIYIIVS